jgi:ABC-type multidrug transport system ATPase subunit
MGQDNKTSDAKRVLGYIPEIPAVYDLLTVNEHIEFIRRAWRMEEDEARERGLLERLELWEQRKKTGRELSKGMKQKLSIACALVHKPEVAVFDEPLVGLDPHAIKELKQIFRELKTGGCAVLISTHMIDSVEDYWDVAHIMVNGDFAATKRNTPEETESQSLESLFFETTEGSEKR